MGTTAGWSGPLCSEVGLPELSWLAFHTSSAPPWMSKGAVRSTSPAALTPA